MGKPLSVMLCNNGLWFCELGFLRFFDKLRVCLFKALSHRESLQWWRTDHRRLFSGINALFLLLSDLLDILCEPSSFGDHSTVLFFTRFLKRVLLDIACLQILRFLRGIVRVDCILGFIGCLRAWDVSFENKASFKVCDFVSSPGYLGVIQ